MSQEQILEALAALSAEVAGDVREELLVMGGAALVLLFGARQSTKDVDVAGISSALRLAAGRVAARLGLPSDWLNDAAKGFAHGGGAPGSTLYESEKLIVRAMQLHQLLAMKLSAWRDDADIGDARLLLSKIEGSRAEIWERVAPHIVPGRELKASYAFDDLWEEQHGRT